MFRPVSVFIGTRYTRAKRSNQFVSFISLLSLLGMMLGVTVLIVVLSVMNGFESEIRGRLLAAIPHLQVERVDGRLEDPASLAEQIQQYSAIDASDSGGAGSGLVGSAPYISGNGMMSVSGLVRGVQITGISPAADRAVSELSSRMISGELDNLQPGDFGVVVGAVTARHFGLRLGDKLAITLPKLVVTPLGAFPRVKRFTVVGVFELGAQVDSTSVFVHLEDASTLFHTKGAVHGLRLKMNDMFAAPILGPQLAKQLGPEFRVRDWSTAQGGLFQAIQMEKIVVGFLLMIVVAVAGFNIVSIVLMMVSDKRSAIAVLRTMGMKASSIIGIFVTQGSMIGLVGVALGTLIGLALAANVGAIVAGLEGLVGAQLFDPSVYYVAHVPSVIDPSQVMLISGSALLLSILATIYPSWRAARVQAAEVLRYE